MSDFTLAQLKEIITSLSSRPNPRENFRPQLPACGYESWSDEEFISFVKGAVKADAVFQGGSAGVQAFRDRCERLNLK